jgi:pimeloyl-ACP methyl ester carboxylesterase
MLWGGLRPIPRQVALDAATLCGLAWAVWILPNNVGVDHTTRRNKANNSTKLLLASCLLTLAISGLSNRWTLTLPMAPLLVLHFLHRLLLLQAPTLARNDEKAKPQRYSRSRRWLLGAFSALSFLCIAAGAALSVLFPAVELPPIKGPYNVGVIDFFIPIEIRVSETRNLTKVETDKESTCSAVITTMKQYIPARLLYPTSKGHSIGGGIPYLNPSTAIDFCRHSMRFGAPDPLKRFDWILHTWRLTTLSVIPDAPILPDGELMPLVVYSHGLGGSIDLYSYQTMSLAAHGSVVVALTHTDGSAPVVPQPPGMEALQHNHDVLELHHQGKTVEYVRARRAQTERRVQEFLGAAEFLHQIMIDFKGNGDELHPEYQQLAHRLRPYLKRLQANHTFFMGHSFGGTTALSAAHRRPDLAKAIIAHEPAIDWAPDDCRRSLFADDRLEGLTRDYNGGTGGFETEIPKGQEIANSIHDLDILVLNSKEWMDKDWGAASLLNEMHRNGRLGKQNGVSSYGVVKDTTHNEFADTCMLTPLWLARPVGLTGPRNPIDTAVEIAERTRSFLEKSRKN